MNNKIKILYVDDEPLNLLLFEANFDKKFNILTASDGFAGLEVMNKHTDIDVIISDMKMPGMNGIEFIAKAKLKFPDKKYYILTGFDITEEIKEALETGVIVKYFKKPYNADEIEFALKDTK